MAEDCRFCKLVPGNRILYEDKFFYSIIEIHPVSPGHSIVISKRHVVDLRDLSSEEWEDLKTVIWKTIKKVGDTDLTNMYKLLIESKISEKSPVFCKKMLGHMGLNKKPDGHNIGVNDGMAAGRVVDHFHLHIIPRYSGDVKDPTGGIRNVIPDLGNYK